MSDFLIYAARLQDAGISQLRVMLDLSIDGTRLMRVSLAITSPTHPTVEMMQRYPERTFELCGTDRVLERVKDDMIYGEGGVTPEKVQAAIAAHPLLRDDLCAFLADWTLVQMPTDDELAAIELTPEEEATGKRMADKVKAWMHGMDIARRRDAARA